MKKLLLLMMIFLIPTQTNARTCIDMGLFKITYYCECESCSNGFGRKTHSGKIAKSGRTVAVDPEIIDIGSKVKIGDKTYVAEDVGGRVKGDTIDIFVDSHEETVKKGVKYANVKIIK